MNYRPVAISADNRLCATVFPNTRDAGVAGGELLLWKGLDTKAELAATIPLPAKEGVSHYRNALSPGGTLLAHTKRARGEIVLEDISMGALNWLAFSPDGKRLAYASFTGVGVLEVPTLKTMWNWQSPGPVNWVDWAADGRHLVTHNGNMTVYVLRLWSR